MDSRKIIMDKIIEGFDECPILRKKGYSVNELLYAIKLAKIGNVEITLTESRAGTFSFGWLESFWPTKSRAKKVKQFGVWIDDTGTPVIDIVTY